jgi:phosphoglycolate phosphatase
LGCVTNKASQFTLPVLRDLGIRDMFQIVVAGDTLSKQKPDPLPLLYAADQLGVTPAESLMIGDSQSDVKAARAAGFQIVCMSYGYNHGEDIRNYHPDAVFDSLTEVRTIL